MGSDGRGVRTFLGGVLLGILVIAIAFITRTRTDANAPPRDVQVVSVHLVVPREARGVASEVMVRFLDASGAGLPTGFHPWVPVHFGDDRHPTIRFDRETVPDGASTIYVGSGGFAGIAKFEAGNPIAVQMRKGSRFWIPVEFPDLALFDVVDVELVTPGGVSPPHQLIVSPDPSNVSGVALVEGVLPGVYTVVLITPGQRTEISTFDATEATTVRAARQRPFASWIRKPLSLDARHRGRATARLKLPSCDVRFDFDGAGATAVWYPPSMEDSLVIVEVDGQVLGEYRVDSLPERIR